ncbi:hypothetical protein HO133_003008 [Letharia lupina]|uniref:F-box domain-containing protein n=1 Tax=Letharia lupina TaxID=560253 RepID=A0A8H6CBL9_9LECA|nr:uncharacterized protein HO133_003008 [Letharia lupina]KAF6220575.1 hypothetical protein HO133_003008 [Letharia lupina]
MATPFGPFNNVPNETLLNILSSVNATDHLSVKLVSKRFRGWATDIDTTTLTLAEVFPIFYDAGKESGDSEDPCRSWVRLVLAESWDCESRSWSSVAGLSVLGGSEPEGQSIRGSTTEEEID